MVWEAAPETCTITFAGFAEKSRGKPVLFFILADTGWEDE